MYLTKNMPEGLGNLVIPTEKHLVSISFDDSCGVFDIMWRGDIRVFNKETNEDVTEKLLKNKKLFILNYISNTYENMCIVVKAVKRFEKLRRRNDK